VSPMTQGTDVQQCCASTKRGSLQQEACTWQRRARGCRDLGVPATDSLDQLLQARLPAGLSQPRLQGALAWRTYPRSQGRQSAWSQELPPGTSWLASVEAACLAVFPCRGQGRPLAVEHVDHRRVTPRPSLPRPSLLSPPCLSCRALGEVRGRVAPPWARYFARGHCECQLVGLEDCLQWPGWTPVEQRPAGRLLHRVDSRVSESSHQSLS
jgi:hypothetical protein